MHLHLNPIGGLAGDMFCAALLDASPELLPAAREAVACLEMPRRVEIGLRESEGELKGKRFTVTPEGEEHHHHHRAFREILGLLERAPLATGVRERAVRIFTLLAEAEGEVHGVAPEEVEFHEVGSWDSIADIVSAAALLEALQVESASCAPLPLGGGRIQCAHGLLPVPAPATALLLEGLPLCDDGIAGERVTPTGAAILRSLEPAPALPGGGTLRTSGMGFGSRSLEGVPNCLQLLCFEMQQASMPAAVEGDRVAVLEFEVDDQTPEEFALAMERLREHEGVLSVTCFQGIGKGGRPTMGVEILVRPEQRAGVAEACFRETTTIGLRWRESNRYILPRRHHRVETGGRQFGVKVVERPDGATAKIELRDVAAMGGQAQRAWVRRLAEEQALEQEETGE